MRAFWDEFSKAVDQTKDLKISDVINALDQDLGPHFFPAREDGSDPRVCAACGNGRLGLKLGRYGSFIGCSNYPECRYTRSLAIDTGDEGGDTLKDGQRVLGRRSGNGRGNHRPARAVRAVCPAGRADRGQEGPAETHHLPRGMDGDKLTLEQAIGLLSLPRDGRAASGDARNRSRSGSGGSGRMCGWARCSARSTGTTTCWRWA